MIIDFVSSIFSTSGFPARWNCGTAWAAEPWWGWIHILSDIVIWAAYFSLGMLIVLFVRKKRDVSFPVVFLLFGAFILLCGFTHLMDSLVFYWPAYRFAGLIKLATALVSFVTIAVCLKLAPLAIELRGPKESDRLIRERTAALEDLNCRLREEIEERSRVVLQLSRNQEALKLAMTISQTGFFDWDLATNLVKMDEAEVRLTGLGKSNGMVHLDEFFECIDKDHRKPLKQVIEDCIANGREYHSRFPFTSPDGKKLWLAGRGCAIQNSKGKPISFIGLNYDITEQVEREILLDREAADARNASQQKSRFIAQVGHEIRTPLAAMLGCVDSLVFSLEPGDTRDTIRILRSQGELLQVLINDVLDFSKLEAGRLDFQTSPVATENIFADVLSLMNPLAQEKGLIIKWQVESKLPKSIVCDRHRLKQVCVNLIGNAIKFTEEGAITIVVKVDDTDPKQSDLIVEIRDTGQGIPKEKLILIFEEYERVAGDVDGSGLGLAISKRLVNMMGGSLEVQSEVGVGSAFVIRIPLGDISNYEMVIIEDIALDAVKMDAGDDVPLKLPLRVLAAEDTRAIQFVLKRMVGSFVDELVVVPNGVQVVQVAMAAENSDKPFDLILMDIQMPEMNGADATRQLRSAGYIEPIIALTAGAMESEKQACINAGCTHFLSKPIDMHELRRLLASLCP